MDGLDHKLCQACGETKILSEFYIRRAAKDGRQAVCRPCHRGLSAAKRAEDPEYGRKKAAMWRANNRDLARQKKRDWERRNPERKKAIDCRAGKKWRSANRASEAAKLARYRAALLSATPAWADQRYIALWYKHAELESARTGKRCHVDHIVPLKSPFVCGLHCEQNMQVLFASANQSKANRHWPDMS